MNTFFKNWLYQQSSLTILLIGIITLLSTTISYSQCIQNTKGQWVKVTGESCSNTIITSVPFLRIAPDARSTAMGDAGIAISADANALHFNASKLAFAENRSGYSLSYTPWLRSLNLIDIYLGYVAGYFQFDPLNTVGLDIKYFSLGDFKFTDPNGMPINGGLIADLGRPNELAVSASFIRKLGPQFSGGIGLNYIYSNLTTGSTISIAERISSGQAIAVDFSFTYQIPNLTIGLAATNLGQKITYTSSINKDFIPANLGIGIAWHKQFSKKVQLSLTTDINKLLVPTPDPNGLDANNDGVPDYQQKSTFESIFSSFGDAPGGFPEEIKELMLSMGAELWLANVVAFRAGYFWEDATKGNRKYLTAGLGFKYKTFSLNGSYLISKADKNPLDKTLRFSLLLNFGKLDAVKNS